MEKPIFPDVWHNDIADRGCHQDASQVWYGGFVFQNGSLKEFDEDCSFLIIDLSDTSTRSVEDSFFSYNFDDIDRESKDLQIPWKPTKDSPFGYANKYIGFI